MAISCVKGAVLVDWVQGFCCVRKEGRAKGPCLHCFVAGDVNSSSGKVRVSGGHLTNFVTHERSRSLNQSLNNTPPRTLYVDMHRHVQRCRASIMPPLSTKGASIKTEQSQQLLALAVIDSRGGILTKLAIRRRARLTINQDNETNASISNSRNSLKYFSPNISNN
jgi:hypothetical protein